MSDFDTFDELDAVRDFRATLAVLEPAANERIRALIVARAQARPTDRRDDDLIILEPTEPVIDVREPVTVPAPDRSIDDAPAAAVVELPAARRPASVPSRRVLAAAAAILVVLLTATAVVRSRSTDTPGTRIDTATQGSTAAPAPQPQTLRDFADLVRSAAASPLGTDSYAHTKWRVGALEPGDRSEVEYEQWASAANGGKLVGGPSVQFSLEGPTTTAVRGAGSTTTYSASSTPFLSVFTYDQVLALPSTPDALDAAIRTARRTQTFDVGTVAFELKLVGSPVVAGPVRAAALELLASQGFVPAGTRSFDLLGTRSGTAFERTANGSTITVLLEANTGSPIAVQETVAEVGVVPNAGNAAVGTLLSFEVYEVSNVVTGLPS